MDAAAVVAVIILLAALAVGIGVALYQNRKPPGRPGSPAWRPPGPGTGGGSGPTARPTTRPGTRPPTPSGPPTRRPGSSRVRVLSSTPPSYGVPPPGPPGTGGPGRLRPVGLRREGCPYCGDGVDPSESFVRCTRGHTHHQDCMRAAGGRCALPHCPGTAG